VLGAGSAVAALRDRARLRRLLKGSTRREATSGPAARSARHLVGRAAEAGLGALAIGSSGYPSMLLDLGDPPAVLWTRGDPTVVGLPGVAVVGARRATESGRRVAHEIGVGLAEAGLVVVSGMALGVDAAAHEGALAGGGLTIAVLGSGADRPSPTSHRRLYERIVRSGVVLSEFDPGARAAPFHFPRRNRVIAALTHAVVVVEAAERSGALITVDHALDLGRTVYAAPGPLDRPQSAGTNGLIRDGARVVTSVGALVDELGEELGQERSRAPQTSETGRLRSSGTSGTPPFVAAGYERDSVRDLASEAPLRVLLEEGPASLDELVRRSGIPVGEVGSTLLEMELRGTVRADGVLYRRVRR